MKRRFFIGLLLLFIIVPSSVMAGKDEFGNQYGNIHYFSLSGGIGYSTIFEDFQEWKTVGSVGGTLFAGYELRVNHFSFNTGLEMQYLSAQSLLAQSGFNSYFKDSQGKDFEYQCDFNRVWDMQHFLFGNVPIMVGYFQNGFYINAGLKLGCCIWSKEMITANYTTKGIYEQYIDPFKQMESHKYSNFQTSASAKLPATKIKASVCAEIGYDIFAWARKANSTERQGLKFGLFAEYGLNNITVTDVDQPIYSVDPKDYSQLILTPFYSARSAKAHRAIPFYAGIRVTWLLSLGQRNCDCHNDNHKMKKDYVRFKYFK